MAITIDGPYQLRQYLGLPSTGDVMNGTATNKPGIALESDAVIPSGAATVTLTANQSGSTFLLDAASGVTYTLPPIQVGLRFRFFTTVSVTSNFHIVTAGATNGFMAGVIVNLASAVTAFAGNGSSHVQIKSNGTTTGGLIGSDFTVYAATSGIWCATGLISGSSTGATPFST